MAKFIHTPTRQMFKDGFEQKQTRNPAGSKKLRRYYKAKNAVRGTFGEAVEWWLGYNPQVKRA
jgi:hypothetical protein